ncbi:phosphotransferase family protein [Halopiger goleimassiliensis]|uniref:phosphotransferase family protein n=1 Tax=Halopiger goleimassiliensis TaxID=1293048 RepID=UPI000677D0B7|nr:phosphotransferase [Halopiger goleimassiliensis]
MDDVPDARAFSEATLEEMLRSVDPDWELLAAEPAERGFSSVYRLTVADDERTRELYLKASPDGRTWRLPTESRIQAVLRATTSIPVPEVVGVVDDHDAVPTPWYLMEALPGEELPYERVARLEDAILRRLARQVGEYLGELHAVPAPDDFGHVRHDGPALRGGRPAGDPSTLTVTEARTWPEFLRAYADRELERHADSRFGALTPELRSWLEREIDALEGPFEAALGRNDHGLHNLLVDPETGDVMGMLDWGYTLVVPPAFDLAFATYIFSGAFLAGCPDVRDRRPLVRDALAAGYRTTAPDREETVPVADPRYEALAMIRITNDFDQLTLPDGTETAVEERLEADLEALLERERA